MSADLWPCCVSNWIWCIWKAWQCIQSIISIIYITIVSSRLFWLAFVSHCVNVLNIIPQIRGTFELIFILIPGNVVNCFALWLQNSVANDARWIDCSAITAQMRLPADSWYKCSEGCTCSSLPRRAAVQTDYSGSVFVCLIINGGKVHCTVMYQQWLLV